MRNGRITFFGGAGSFSCIDKKVEEFRNTYEVPEEAADRIVTPSLPFYGKDILEMAIAGLLEGENLLLTGPKATGKNILAENLSLYI